MVDFENICTVRNVIGDSIGFGKYQIFKMAASNGLTEVRI